MHITRSATCTFVYRRLTKQKSTLNAYTLTDRDRDREFYSDERKKGREALDRLLTQKRRRREESEKTPKKKKKTTPPPPESKAFDNAESADTLLSTESRHAASDETPEEKTRDKGSSSR
jgi:hypothetical protein